MVGSPFALDAPTLPRRATLAEWLAEPQERGAELLSGRVVYKALPIPEHGYTQSKLGAELDRWNCKPGDAARPGGWWLATEVDLHLVGHGLRPDLTGWRRDRIPRLPRPKPGEAVTERPDWVAEILSPSTAARDLGEKLAIYHAAGIPHYWVLDPAARVLLVYRHTPDGYLHILGATEGQTVRAEPFDGLPLDVGNLFTEPDDAEGAP